MGVTLLHYWRQFITDCLSQYLTCLFTTWIWTNLMSTLQSELVNNTTFTYIINIHTRTKDSVCQPESAAPLNLILNSFSSLFWFCSLQICFLLFPAAETGRAEKLHWMLEHIHLNNFIGWSNAIRWPSFKSHHDRLAVKQGCCYKIHKTCGSI